MPPGEPPLRADVQTGQNNPVLLRPFRVQNASCPQRWDPSQSRLAVGYDISDPNSRIRSGRVRYFVTVPGGEVTIHRQTLARSQYQHGRCYELAEGERWDGTISEGLDGRNGTENRVGQKVTADLSPVAAIVEVWNTTRSEPGARIRHGEGRTEVAGEWYASSVAVADIDAIVRARWDTEWVIPFDDPDEPQKGVAGMNIEVRNVREATPVRFEICRVMDVADPSTDQPYVDSSWGEEDQPGLQNAVVRGGRVVRQGSAPPPRRGRRREGPYVPPGNLPYVRFNQYDEHWKQPGNNFYAFRVAFGESGLSMVASERNYVEHERDCLHMRFTVFIHCPSTSLPTNEDYVGSANELQRFFRKTKYYRSYLKSGPLGSMARWVRYYSHRYIVLIDGHAACGCGHSSHPTRMVGTGANAKKKLIDLHHRGFTPDKNTCPVELETSKEGKKDLRWEAAHYHHPFGGCGNRSHVFHMLALGGSRPMYLGHKTGATTRNQVILAIIPRVRGAELEKEYIAMGSREPRLLFFCGGCRTTLSTNFGEHFVQNGTKYFHGWIYSVWIRENRKFARKFFKRFIKGTSDDPAETEYDLRRLEPAYRAVAGEPGITSHPRLMDSTGVLNARPAPSSTAEAMD